VAAVANLTLLVACAPASNLQATTNAGNEVHATETQAAMNMMHAIETASHQPMDSMYAPGTERDIETATAQPATDDPADGSP
jgi:hypothetical protein